MKRHFLIVPLLAALAACAWLAAPRASAQAQTELRIAFIPYANPGQLLTDVKPVTELLGRQLGVHVQAFVVLDYAAVVEALRSKRADIAFMGPLQYVIARRETGAIPLLGEKYYGRSTYTSKIFVRKDSNITTLAELRGKTIAFVDPISSSGYMYPLAAFFNAELMQPGEDPHKFFRRIYFAGGDEQAIRAAHNKFADAAGVSEFSLMLLRPEERNAIRAIATSPDSPAHCVVARAGLDPRLRDGVQATLLGLEGSRNAGYLKSLYNVSGYTKVTPQTYSGVEALARQSKIIP